MTDPVEDARSMGVRGAEDRGAGEGVELPLGVRDDDTPKPRGQELGVVAAVTGRDDVLRRDCLLYTSPSPRD